MPKQLSIDAREITKRHDGGRYRLLRAVLVCLCLAGFAAAQDHNHKHEGAAAQSSPEAKPSREDASPGKLAIPDTEVLTQDGKPVKFYTDLVKGKKVMISFIFTSCRATCPFVGRNFQKLQEQIGAGLGKDIFLITVSTDPTVDTPEVLKKWGDRFGRREGWTLVTGEEAKIYPLLKTLTGTTRLSEGDHNSVIVLFDGVSGASDSTSSLMRPVILLEGLSKLGKTP